MKPLKYLKKQVFKVDLQYIVNKFIQEQGQLYVYYFDNVFWSLVLKNAAQSAGLHIESKVASTFHAIKAIDGIATRVTCRR